MADVLLSCGTTQGPVASLGVPSSADWGCTVSAAAEMGSKSPAVVGDDDPLKPTDDPAATEPQPSPPDDLGTGRGHKRSASDVPRLVAPTPPKKRCQTGGKGGTPPVKGKPVRIGGQTLEQVCAPGPRGGAPMSGLKESIGFGNDVVPPPPPFWTPHPTPHNTPFKLLKNQETC